MTLKPRLLVAIVLLWAVTVAVQSRPATDSGEPEIEESAELSPDPSVVMVPIRQLVDPNSALARILNNQLLKMSEQDLQAIETGLTGTKTKPVISSDQDMMMGDMPSADDPQDSSSPATMFERVTMMTDRESPESEDPEIQYVESSTSARQQRIKDIQRQMINLTGRKTILPPIPVTKTGPISSYPSDSFTEKTQSFYSTCDLPKHTNEDVWNTKEAMNLMFNISLPKSSKGITVNINTARLRLYKQFVSCYSQSSNETDDSQSCQPALFVETMKQSNLTTASVVPIIMDERQIRVSIYLNTRSLKRKRVKRKLLDSRMVPYFSEKWTEWNIRNAAKAWHRNPVRNYGISIEVEDEDGNLLPVAKFFRPMNCSGDAQTMTPKPMPGFLMEAVQNSYGVPVRNPITTGNNSNTNVDDALALSFNMHMYPIMDVTTIEVPDSEANNAMLYQYAKSTLEQVGGRGAGSSLNLSPGQEYMVAEFQHRIRHGSQYRNNGTLPGGLSKDGHELRDQIIPQSIIQWNVQHKSTTTETPD